jgi:hypothetical protein
MSHEIENYLASFTPDIQDLARRTLALVEANLPGLQAHVHEGWGTVQFTHRPGSMKGVVCHVSAYKQHVNLGFPHGAALPDPAGLLEGTGKSMRHIKLKALAELENPTIAELLRAAHAKNAELFPG